MSGFKLLHKKQADLTKSMLKQHLSIAKEKAIRFLNIARSVSAELYAICPNHKLFTGDTFPEESMKLIREEAKLKIIESDYEVIVYTKRFLVSEGKEVKSPVQETVDLIELRSQIEKELQNDNGIKVSENL